MRQSLIPLEGAAALADGSGLPIYGRIEITGRLRNVKFTEEFLVCKISDEAILGMSFLRGQECTLACDRGVLIVGAETIACTDRAGNLLANKVQVLRPTVLSPGSEAQLCCRLTTPPSGPVGLVENYIHGDQGIVIAATLCKPQKDGRILVRCMNTMDESLELRAGSVVGLYQPVQPEQVMEVQAEVATCSEDNNDLGQSAGAVSMPEHLGKLYQDAREVCTSEQQEKQLAGVLRDFADVFSKGETDMGRTDLVEHTIPLEPGTDPIRQPPRRLGPEKDKEVESQITKLVQQGLVEPTDSAWSSPVVLVRKKDQSWRLCVDYRRLNSVTKRDAFPLPRIDDSLDSLSGSVFFSTLDLLSGYWQVPLDTEAQERSAFVTRGGLWRWKVLPFGLTSAPATFERLMEQVLKGLQWKTLLLYLDDVIVFSRDFDSHLERLAAVLKRFRSAGLKLKPSKCELLRREVKYLGHVVSERGIATDPEKVVAVREWKRPTCVAEVRAFLGFIGYYRRFFQDFAAESKPLNRLTSNAGGFKWGDQEEQAFQALKERVATAPVLAYPKAGVEYILDTDASLDGAGAVLAQLHDGEERVVAYFSKTFSPAQRNYCVTRRELLAVILAVGHFRPYLYGQKFRLRTDHASLLWLYKRSEPSHQVARWLELLAEFDFRMEHRPGRKHSNADGLSRCSGDCKQCMRIEDRDGGPRKKEVEEDLDEVEYINTEWTTKNGVLQAGAVGLESQTSSTEITELQQNSDLVMLTTHLIAGTVPSLAEMEQASSEVKRLGGMFSCLRMKDNTLQAEIPTGNRTRWCTVCPKLLREAVIWEAHRQHHAGINKTVKRLRLSWYWPGLVADTRRLVRSCEICQAAKHSSTAQSGHRQRLHTGRPWQVVSVDLVGPFNTTPRDNTTVLVLTDHFTRWRDAIPLVDGTAEVVARALDHKVFCYFGLPERVHTDQGAQFESKLFHELCALWGVRKSKTTPYHPQSNGVVERGNKDLGEALRALLIGGDYEDWDLLLPHIMRSLRGVPHASTDETANYLMFGRELRLPDQLVYGGVDPEPVTRTQYASELNQRLQTAYDLLRTRQEQVRSADNQEEPLFKAGEKVWLKAKRFSKGKGRKLQSKFVGPYTILTVNKNHTYVVELKGRVSTESESRLKRYVPSEHPGSRAPALCEPTRQPSRQGMNRTGEAERESLTGLPGRERIPYHLPELQQRKKDSRCDNTGECPTDHSISNSDDLADGEGSSSQLEASPESNSESTPALLGRPRRTRNLPPRLADFELSTTNCNAVIGTAVVRTVQFRHSTSPPAKPVQHPQYSTSMAQKHLDVLQVHEEGELSEMSSEGEAEESRERTGRDTVTLSGSRVDKVYVSEETVEAISYLFRQSKPYGGCQRRGCRYASRTPERLLIHLEQHYIVYAWKCGFLSSSRDSILKHVRKQHKGSRGPVVQLDRDNWEKGTELIPNLPLECPLLPMLFKPAHVPCVPGFKRTDSVKSSKRQAVEDTPTVKVKVSRVERAEGSLAATGKENHHTEIDNDEDEETRVEDEEDEEARDEEDEVVEEAGEPSAPVVSVLTGKAGMGIGRSIVLRHLPPINNDDSVPIRKGPTLLRDPLFLSQKIEEKTYRARDLRRIAAEIDEEANVLRKELAQRELQDRQRLDGQ